MARDVICNMDVDEETALWKSEHMGKTYYFCREGCKQTFDQNPVKYAEIARKPMRGGCCG